MTTHTAGTIGEYPKKSAMEIAFGKIKGIMEELKDTNSPAAKNIIKEPTGTPLLHTNT